MRALRKVGRVALCVLVAVCLGLIAFPLIAVAFHPFDGLVDGYSQATLMERYLALAIAAAISLATLWRLLRGNTIREEIRRASDSIDSGES